MKNSPKSHRKLYHLLAGAIALALPSLALAQGQIDTGRSNDASNRIGSGGRNASFNNAGGYGSNYVINNGNQIITGNVSNGKEFHGNVGYTDPSAFRGPTGASTSDNFIKNSNGVPQAHTAEFVPGTSTPFYGASQTAQPPAGYQLNANRTGYVPQPPPEYRGIQDRRLGVIDLNQPIAPMPQPGELLTRGSLNPQQAAQDMGILSASTLYGVREWNPRDPADRAFLENILNRQGGNYNRNMIDPRDLQRMRNELDPELQKPAGLKSFDSAGNPNVPNPALADSIKNQPLGQTGFNTDQGTRFNVIGARKTSTQYTELDKRLEQFNIERKKTGADQAMEFNAQLKAKKEAEAKLANKNKNPNELPSVPPRVPTDPTTVDPTKPKVKKPQPLKVNSLAATVHGEGLSNVMKKAEGLMKQGKFTSALDQYDIADAVTPNNPLIWLGRANAELGAGFFMRADGHLRQALTADKALLMGQYDLTGMLGEERLGKIVNDLKDIANKDANKPNAVFLLAYVAYNTGHERQALGYLDLAEKRAGDQTAFYKMIREHWALPEEGIKPEGDLKPDASKTPEVKRELNK